MGIFQSLFLGAEFESMLQMGCLGGLVMDRALKIVIVSAAPPVQVVKTLWCRLWELFSNEKAPSYTTYMYVLQLFNQIARNITILVILSLSPPRHGKKYTVGGEMLFPRAYTNGETEHCNKINFSLCIYKIHKKIGNSKYFIDKD